MENDFHQLIKEKLVDLIANIFARVFVTDFSEEKLQELVQGELALERAIAFTSSFITVGNVLGYSPKNSIDSWIKPEDQEYPLIRKEKWESPKRTVKASSSPEQPFEEREDNESSNRSDWSNKAPHNNIETLPLIRLPLWDRANWVGTAFLHDEQDKAPPILALIFRETSAATEIFTHWLKELGRDDTRERLRLTIIRGISKQNVHAYRIAISSNPEPNQTGTVARLFIMTCRMHTMEPSSDINLTDFLTRYNTFNRFFVAPAIMRLGESFPEVLFSKGIAKRELHVKQAWEIGRNDMEVMAIRDDDDPVIPEGKLGAPVIDAIRWLQNLSR